MRYVVIAMVVAVCVGMWLMQERRGISIAASAVPTSGPANSANLKTAIFAAGCFWGVQERFDHVPGVVSTEAGYTGGTLANPTYEDVCSHNTGHAEAVRVTYDPAKVSYAELLDAFWTMHDPTTLDRQGPDFGSNYRSVIFYTDAEQEKIAKASMAEVQASGVFDGKIVTAIVAAGPFYKAEDYHQEYFEKNGGTCHNGVAVVHTKLAAEAKKAREAGATTQP